ncbi:MAG: glycerol kinase GlpK [Pirellulaceae bacterium]
MSRYILALDQGTTSSRAILFSHEGTAVASAQQEFEQILPQPGHVEHDPEAIWQTQLDTARQVLATADARAEDVAAIGIANQRETTVLWERDSGRPVANAIVWQSRVTSGICDQLREQGHEELFQSRTGLVLDAYFSGTKIKYLLDQDPALRRRAEKGEILFGTIDSFLIWRLSGGRYHVTDVSNASRTLLLNIHTREWDEELLKVLDVPRAMLPEVVSSSEVYGESDPALLGAAIPIAGCAGDQQAATFGQACFNKGDVKNTYGTGCFMLMNTGSEPIRSKNRLLTTIGWQVGEELVYCLEGSVFIAGAVVQWLRDGLGIIESSGEVEKLAAEVEHSDGVVVVPAFVGLGAPHWDPHARGAIFGITRGTRAAHLARAAVESMAFQSKELLEAMQRDVGVKLEELKVDGGASINDTLMQFQADLLGTIVRRPVVAETTALGAAYLAGLAVGFWQDRADIEANWVEQCRFIPRMDAAEREQLSKRWDNAVQRTLGWGAERDGA